MNTTTQIGQHNPFKADTQSANAQLVDQMKSLKTEIATLRSDNMRLKNDVVELYATIESVYANQNVHNFPAEMRDRISRVLIENKPV